MPVQNIWLDYPINPKPRYGFGKPAHPKLYEIIDRNRELYKEYLESFFNYIAFLKNIPAEIAETENSIGPYWLNQWMPVLDTAAIYSLLCMNNSGMYLEIGSGNSTKFARRAVKDHNLKTDIISVDPHPRDEIDLICDSIIRQPVEDIDLGIFDRLTKGDILFVDNSHRSFTNSDATVVFLDILPKLKPGVMVEFHDIFLPYDYPPQWNHRYFSEQYLLACYLLAEGSRFDIILPNAFITFDRKLMEFVSPMFDSIGIVQGPAYRSGGSFWIKMK